MKKIVVIGGGIAWLSAGVYAQNALASVLFLRYTG